MIKFIRSFLSGFCFFIFGIGSFFIGSIFFPIIALLAGKKRRFVLVNFVRIVWKFFVWIMCATKLISVRISNEDKQKLFNVKGSVIIANHPSLIDIVILVSFIPNAVCVVKGSLSKNIWMAFIVRMIHIVNDEDVEKFLNDAENLLRSGFNIVIFPEGTRTKIGDFDHKLHRGFAQIALHANTDILPVVIDCMPPILGKNQKWWNVGDRTAVFTLNVKDKISCKNVVKDNDFHENAKKITEFVRQILFFDKKE